MSGVVDVIHLKFAICPQLRISERLYAANAQLFDCLISISENEWRCSCYSFEVRHARNC